MRSGDSESLSRACNDFYTKIPHSYGLKPPPLVRSAKKLKEKSLLIDVLSDEACAKLARFQKVSEDRIDALRFAYASLKYKPRELEKDTKTYMWIEQCVKNTHAPTHDWYRLEVDNIFTLSGDNSEVYNGDEVGNKKMLWHGSRMSNWYGILKNGFRIDPVEAISSGTMFGAGLYFADMVSKAANYCYPNQKSLGILLLSEVALGKVFPRVYALRKEEIDPTCDSVKGIGKTCPDPRLTLTFDGDIDFCLGRPDITNLKGIINEPILLYNEYVVYNVNQVRPRYLVIVKFNDVC